MRLFLLLAGVIALVSVAGCGGGGGGAASTPTVSLDVPSGVTSTLGTPSVTYKSSEQLLGIPSGHDFLGGVATQPASTVFNGGPVTLTFDFAGPLALNVSVALFQKDSLNNWTVVPGAPVVVSADRRSGTVELSGFCATGDYAVLAIVL